MKARVNLTIDKAVAEEARKHGLNMSELAETAIAEANRRARYEAWVEECAEAVEAYRKDLEERGDTFLAEYRTF